MADDEDGERAMFQHGCDVLMELQDDLAWKHVTSKFKQTSAKWYQTLSKIRNAGMHSRTPARVSMPACGLTLSRRRQPRLMSGRSGRSPEPLGM